MTENEISFKIIGTAIEVHKQLGPGLLESSYEYCLAYELRQQAMDVKQQIALPLIYKNVKLDAGYRIDLLIENKVIVEIKAVDDLTDIHCSTTYLLKAEKYQTWFADKLQYSGIERWSKKNFKRILINSVPSVPLW